MRRRLTTPRLLLRRLRAADRPALAELLSDTAATWSPYRGPRGSADVDALLDEQLARWRAGEPARWAVIHDREFVGYAGFAPSPWPDQPDALDIGWRFGERWWGHGLAREAGEAMLRELFRSRAARAALATYEPANERMAALARRLGFVPLFTGTQFGHPVSVAHIDEELWRASEKDR